MPRYEVALPITAVAYLEVEAENEEDAIETAMNEVTMDDIQEWEALKKVNTGNVCHAMHPWDAEANCVD